MSKEVKNSMFFDDPIKYNIADNSAILDALYIKHNRDYIVVMVNDIGHNNLDAFIVHPELGYEDQIHFMIKSKDDSNIPTDTITNIRAHIVDILSLDNNSINDGIRVSPFEHYNEKYDNEKESFLRTAINLSDDNNELWDIVPTNESLNEFFQTSWKSFRTVDSQVPPIYQTGQELFDTKKRYRVDSTASTESEFSTSSDFSSSESPDTLTDTDDERKSPPKKRAPSASPRTGFDVESELQEILARDPAGRAEALKALSGELIEDAAEMVSEDQQGNEVIEGLFRALLTRKQKNIAQSVDQTQSSHQSEGR